MTYYVYVLKDRAGAFAHIEDGRLLDGEGRLIGAFATVGGAVGCWEEETARLRSLPRRASLLASTPGASHPLVQLAAVKKSLVDAIEALPPDKLKLLEAYVDDLSRPERALTDEQLAPWKPSVAHPPRPRSLR